MTALNCSQAVPHLESFHRGDSSPELALLLDEHLARCPACRRRLAHLKQLSSMIAAWRPSRPPRQLRTEIAEAVSDQLAQAAATAWTERARRSLQFPALSAWQRFANWLVIAALLFLGLALVYRTVFQDARSQHPAAISPSSSATASSAEAAREP